MVDMVGSHFGVPWQSYYIEAIARRHDLKYLLATGMISQKRMGSAVSAVTTILESIILYQIAPIGFRNLINNNNFLYQVYFYVDLETNENLLMNEINITGPPSLDYLNNLNYQIMYEIKKSKDK